jgi:hypothetical protein
VVSCGNDLNGIDGIALGEGSMEKVLEVDEVDLVE